MTENIELQFLDTNILVYAFDTSTGRKYEIADALVRQLWDNGAGCISLQVLQEFFVTITHKAPQRMSVPEAREAIRNFSTWTVHRPEVDDVLAAIDIQQRFQISFWDALVIRAAQLTGCSILWSEDLANGQDYGGVVVKNPFLA